MNRQITGACAAFSVLLLTASVRAADPAQPPHDSYPLTTCVVSGEPLGGAMGKPVIIDYKGTEVRFCCKGCIKTFNKDPEKYLAKLSAASADARKKTGAGGHEHGHGTK